ncbi:hypothetical protein L0990_01050 [Vibrio kanaloae]|uniref:hypothetical protein n=1 Tax=Vibrio kanaloae TaxID=170673 RepID=UPI0035A5E77D
MGIGGYNQLSLQSFGSGFGEDIYNYQSARAALYSFCSAQNIKEIYVPNYICDSIFPALKSLGIRIYFYSINDNLLPEKFPIIKNTKSSKVLIVNYFGLLSEELKEIVMKEPEAFIVDNSQALFNDHLEGATSIYSPRKFLGLPDGGFLKTSEKIKLPTTLYDASKKIGHLLLRAAGDVQGGYEQFLEAEKALECYLPKKMSLISSFLIECNNFKKIKECRQYNYNELNSKFKSINRLSFKFTNQVPLCYPLKLDFNVSHICKELVGEKIYLPRYWDNKSNGSLGQDIFHKTLFLPVDERIDEMNISKLISLVESKIVN